MMDGTIFVKSSELIAMMEDAQINGNKLLSVVINLTSMDNDSYHELEVRTYNALKGERYLISEVETETSEDLEELYDVFERFELKLKEAFPKVNIRTTVTNDDYYYDELVW